MRLKLLCLALLLSASASAQSFKELSDSLMHYYQAKDYGRAVPFGEQLVKMMKEKYGTEHKNYSSFLNLLGGIYVSNGELGKAEKALIELQAVNQKIFGSNSSEYINGITLLAAIFNQTGKDENAIPLLEEVLLHNEKKFGGESYEYATTANRLAKLYEAAGQYAKALPYSEKATVITGNKKGVNSSEYATMINNQGLIQKNLGHTEKAEPLLIRAAEIRKIKGGEMDPDYANSLNNLAVLYADLGQLNKSIDHYKRAAAIYKQVHGEQSVEYLTCLSNLGSAYDMAGQYTMAEQVLLEAISAAQKKYDVEWPLYQQLSYNLGQLYLSLGQYNKAEPLILKRVETTRIKNERGYDHAGALNDLAFLYNYTDRKTEAEKLYGRSAQIIKDLLGEGHRDHGIALHNLATVYHMQQRYEEAIANLEKVNSIEINNYFKLFAVLSAEEKLMYAERIGYLQNSNLSTLYRYPAAPDHFSADNFNNQLFLKSLLLTDGRNLLASVRGSADTVVRKTLEQWQENKKALAVQYALPEASRKRNLSELEEQTERLEKELVRRSATFRDIQAGLRVKMENVRDKLAKNEAAIEFVNFRLMTQGSADSVMYGAFVLRKQDKAPLFVSLFEEKQLTAITGKNLGGSSVIINNLYPGQKATATPVLPAQLFALLWQPLEQHLAGIKRINFAPAGLLNQIAFHALKADSTKLLADKYELRQYLSTRDIVEVKGTPLKPANALLMGDPDFSGGKTGTNAPIWQDLGGTAQEISEIKKIFDANGVTVQVKLKENATEENIKLLDGRSPQLLYIATHGFFIPGFNKQFKTATSYGRNVLSNTADPLFRSGLILAGGNNAWSGQIPAKGSEDGILTAYEISQLDLSKTQLVVLSACETARGDIQGTEGVFGLQRAFRLAGADKMIVSLWKVPDKETAELMIEFNKQWLRGKSPADALTSARAMMQAKYPPYFWAAFVLVE